MRRTRGIESKSHSNSSLDRSYVADAMHQPVAVRAQSNEIFFRIFAGVAAKLLMMHFDVLPGSTELAAPAIAQQHIIA